MLDRLDFITRMRLRGSPAIIGAAFLGVLLLSILLFLLLGNGRVARILYFPNLPGTRAVSELRFMPRHGSIEAEVEETADNVLLGPTRHDAQRLFARGATVKAVMVSGRTVYIDLTPEILYADPEVSLRGADALAVLTRTLRLNFPRFTDVVYLIDGQVPRFPDKKKI